MPPSQDPMDAEERSEILAQLEAWLQTPMLVLSAVWLALVVAELTWGETELLATFGTAIWVVFIAEFALRLAIAPDRWVFLRSNWLTVIALAAPALRMLRVLRFVRLARGLRLVRVVGTANRSMNALRAAMRRRGLGYVLALTLLVNLLGAAGMFAFERGPGGAGFEGFGHALWWTAMLLTTMGADIWPRTPEGRVLCLLLAIYAFTVFGYITASFASYFVGRDTAARR